MQLLAPWALAGLALVPAILLWGCLAPRGRRVVVGSVMVWRRVLAAGPAGRPSARVRLRSPLLWLDAAAVLLGVMAMARPATPTGAPAGPVGTVVLDRTASMFLPAAEGRPRWQAAAGAALAKGALAAAPVRVVAVPDAGTKDLPAVAPLGDVLARRHAGWLPVLADGDVWPTAAAEAARDPDRPVLVATDLVPSKPLPPNVFVLASGGETTNVGLVRAATRVEGDRWWLLASARAAAGAPGPASLRVEADGRVVKEVPAFLRPGESPEGLWAMAGPPTREVRVALAGPAARDGPALGGDDEAYLVLAASRQVRAVLGAGVDANVRRALAACDGVQVLDGPAGEGAIRAASATSGAAEAWGAADLAVVQGTALPPAWTGAAVMVEPPEIEGVLRPTGEDTAAAWRVAADHPLADAFYLAPPRVSRLARYEIGPSARIVCGTPAAPLIVSWEDGGARRLAILFSLERAVTDWPSLAGFPVFWSRATDWLAPGARRAAVHRTHRPFEPVPGHGDLAPGEPGFYGDAGPAGRAGGRVGVSFVGSDEGWQAGPGRSDAARAAEAIRASARRVERMVLRERWPILAVLAIAVLVARAWVAR